MNVGLADALIRVVVGFVVSHLSLVVKLNPVVKWVLVVVGAILFITAATRHCGIYDVFKISTFKGK